MSERRNAITSLDDLLATLPTHDKFGRVIHRRSIPERLIEKSETSTACWRWVGHLTPTGYGVMKVGRRSLAAHRIAYLAFVGDIAEGLEVDHLCRVRSCVKPGHLELVTHRENLRRARLGATLGSAA